MEGGTPAVGLRLPPSYVGKALLLLCLLMNVVAFFALSRNPCKEDSGITMSAPPYAIQKVAQPSRAWLSSQTLRL